MITKTILMAGIALGGIAGSFASAQAASSGVMDCTPHDWLMFGEAVENQDNDALRAMLSMPELHRCEFIVTVRILTCADDASLCPPVIIPDTPPIIFLVDGDDDVPPPAPPAGPFPNQRPGQPYGGPGGDNDEGPDGGEGGDGGDGGDGGNGGGNPGNSAPAGGQFR